MPADELAGAWWWNIYHAKGDPGMKIAIRRRMGALRVSERDMLTSLYRNGMVSAEKAREYLNGKA